jgi:hypothetical protein
MHSPKATSLLQSAPERGEDAGFAKLGQKTSVSCSSDIAVSYAIEAEGCILSRATLRPGAWNPEPIEYFPRIIICELRAELHDFLECPLGDGTI